MGLKTNVLKNSGDGMPSITGSQVTGRRSIYLEDDGGGAELQGDTERTVQLPQMWEIPENRVTGYALPNPERCGEGSYSTGKRRGRRG